MKKTVAAALLAGVLAMTSCGVKTAEPAEEVPAEEEMETELENGILTIKVPHGIMDAEGFSWGLYAGDKGDASLTEPAADSHQEEGYDYAGSFKAGDGSGEGEDYIRIAYADDDIALAYFDIRVAVKDGSIQKITGTDGIKYGCEDTYIPFLEGSWTEVNEGPGSMTVSKGADGSYEIILAGDTGRNGTVMLTTMHAWPDAVQGCLIYRDGAEQAAGISDSEEDAIQIGGGTMTGRIFCGSADREDPTLTWIDTKSGESVSFVKN